MCLTANQLIKRLYMKKSQQEKVKNILIETGQVNRNTCIREEYITRLSAIILDLKKQGWQFRTEQTKNPNNFIYHLLNRPTEKRTLI